MMRFFKGIRFRVMLTISIVLIVAFVIVGRLILYKTEEKLVTVFDRSLKNRAEYLLSRISINPLILPIAAQGEEVCIVNEYYDTKKVLYISKGYPDSTVAENNTSENFRVVSVENEDPDNTESRILLMLAFPTSELKNDLYNLQLLFIAGLTGCVLIVFFAGYVVSAWLLKPLKNISRNAKSIVSAETINSLPLPGSRDELYELTETINGMLQRIKESSDLQKNFFASAAHELRTPLAVMKTGVEVNLGNTEIPQVVKKYFSEQLDDINRISRLLEDFLLISRSDPHIILKKEQVQLAVFTGHIVAKLKSVSDDYGIKINMIFEFEESPLITTDLVKLEHILINLLENAVKYAVSNTTVTCTVGEIEQNHYYFKIQNQTEQEKGEVMSLFQAFYQGNPFKEGHGMGLWISNRLATMLDGKLEIQWKEFNFNVMLVV